MSFPASPSNGQTHTTANGTTYTYNQGKNAWYVTAAPGGVPTPTQQYQLLQADASLNWQPTQSVFGGNY